MDPRNFLGSDTVFSFMLQGYDPSKQTEAGVRKIVKGTFLDTDDYVSYIMKAAQETSYSPYVMASKILQEIGRNNGNSPFISGKYPGFEGYYNYFNINATGNNDTEKIVKALTYAKDTRLGHAGKSNHRRRGVLQRRIHKGRAKHILLYGFQY